MTKVAGATSLDTPIRSTGKSSSRTWVFKAIVLDHICRFDTASLYSPTNTVERAVTCTAAQAGEILRIEALIAAQDLIKGH